MSDHCMLHAMGPPASNQHLDSWEPIPSYPSPANGKVLHAVTFMISCKLCGFKCDQVLEGLQDCHTTGHRVLRQATVDLASDSVFTLIVP